MATVVPEHLLNSKRDCRYRKKKLFAIFFSVFLLIAVGSFLVFGKYSIKLRNNDISGFQKEIELLRHQVKSLLKNQNKTPLKLQQQLKQKHEEKKKLLNMFESYKKETSKELSLLKIMNLRDQQEIERLQKELQVQRSDNSNKGFENKKKGSQNYPPNDVRSKNALIAKEVQQKLDSNVFMRSAKAVKDYIFNLALNLNPFRNSQDKTQSLPKENVNYQDSKAKKKLTVLPNDINNTLENLVSLLNNAAKSTNHFFHGKITQAFESNLHYIDLLVEDYTKNNLKNQDRILKWKKIYLPIKEQFEKLKQENALHGSRDHRYSSQHFQKLADMTQHLKNTFRSFIKP